MVRGQSVPLRPRSGPVWQRGRVRMRLARRPLVAGLLLAAALSGVTGCRTDPNVAAYVGDARVTEAELDSAVARRLEDPAIARFADGHEAEYTRGVLNGLVQREVYAAVAARYHVEISDDEVQARIRQVLEGQDPTGVYDQLARQGYSRADVVESVRQQLVREQVAEAEGLAGGLSEAALRSTYEKDKQKYARFQLGLITVPDEATANTVVAQLDADPGAYARLAARFPGNYTLPELQTNTSDQLTADLQAAVASARPNTAVAVPVQNVPGVVVAFVGRVVYRSFDEVRGDLEKAATAAADEAAAKVIARLRDDLHITVNPRYGELKNGTIQPGDGGVVDILENPQARAAGGSPDGATAPQPTN
jgi:hypothetical protein